MSIQTEILKNRLMLREALSNINEIDMYDSAGNMIIKQGLKVKHKETGYEYTIDSLDSSNDEGVFVILRMPDDPRKPFDNQSNETLRISKEELEKDYSVEEKLDAAEKQTSGK